MKRLIKWILALIAIAFAILIIAFFGLAFSFCSDEIVDEVKSPDGNYIATAFDSNCGATSPYHTTVTIRAWYLPFLPFFRGKGVFYTEGQPAVKLLWVADNRLKISYSDDAHELEKKPEGTDLIVDYETFKGGRNKD